MHGVGISVVNALSKRVVVQVRRDGNTYEMEFSRGKTVKKMEVVGTSDSTGTTVTFWPDDEIFETCIYDFDTLHNRLQETAFLNKNLKIVLTDEREATPHVEEFCYEGGIIDFVKFLNEGKDVIYSAWWMILFPGLFTALAVLGLNIFGDGLRDFLDPHTN